MKIIGIEFVRFIGKDGTPVEGKTFHVTEPIAPQRGQGEHTERFFLSSAKIAALSFVPSVGAEVSIQYNRYGKVSSLILDPLAFDPEID